MNFSDILNKNNPQSLLAYFSHSYSPRPKEKELNLFFWKLLSKHHLYVAVDPETSKGTPMDIPYLEWMMKRSACFVAVILHRDDSPLYNCSPYQVFEIGLAMRAKKPRLLFVEEGLDSNIFGALPEEICSFNRRKELLEQKMNTFVLFVKRLVSEAHSSVYSSMDLRKSVALLVDTTQGTVYNPGVVKHIQGIVRNQGYRFGTINPAEFERDFLFFKTLGEYSLLISEVRQPYIKPEVLGLIHGRCIPSIRICHLAEHENVEETQAMMHLSINEDVWSSKESSDLPIIFSKYQIGENTEPVIFWKDINELSTWTKLIAHFSY